METTQTVILGLLLCLARIATTSLLDAEKFKEELINLANNGLGIQQMQDHFDTLEFTHLTQEGSDLIDTLRNSLIQKFSSRVEALKDLKEAIEASYEQTQGEFEECCAITSGLEVNSRFAGKELDISTACTRISDNVTPNGRQLSNEVIDVMKQNYGKIPSMKWQFFGSEDGIFTIYPANKIDSCTGYDNRYRPFYVEGSTPEAKNLVVVIDKSASMRDRHGSHGKTLMQIAIDAVTTVLKTLNPNDKVGVVTFSDDVDTLHGNSNDDAYLNCFGEELAMASLTNIKLLGDFIAQLRPDGGTNYGIAFQKAFDLLKAASTVMDGIERDQVILFVTDGLPNDDKDDIMKIVRRNNEEMGNKAVILTIGLGTDEDLSFLQDLAEQNFVAHGLPAADTDIGEIKKGEYTQVTDYTKLRSTMARYYDFFAVTENLREEPIFSVPYQDAFGLGLMTTAALPVKYQGELKGVVGTDFTLDDLFADITYFREGEKSYAFLFEANTKAEGRTLMHPLLPAPAYIEEDPVYVHITSLEREEKFRDIIFFNSTNGQDEGEATFFTRRSLPRGNSVTEGVYETSVESTYYWRQVDGSPYIVCLVNAVGDFQTVLKPQQPTGNDFLYHRIDLVKPPSSCRHANRHATKAQSTVKFAPNAFINPVDYLELRENKIIIGQYEDYMNDATGNVVYNHFRGGIKDMVTATAKVNELWINDNTGYEDYTLYRYIGTTNGVFREFPGVRMNDMYDPTVRPWFQRSKSNKGVLTLSAPYQAASGAGYVITLSKTIVETHTSDPTPDDVVAVMGMDFTLTYFNDLMLRSYPECSENRYSCFIMDNSGYLVVHEEFLQFGELDVTKSHITEMEPMVARDLISEGTLTKEACIDFQHVKNRHYYTVQTSSLSNIDKLDDSDGCKRYQLTHILETNAFLGIIDKTIGCAKSPCPCYYDRCLATDSDACECPCLSMTEEYDYCNDDFTFTSDAYASCSPSPSLSPIIDDLDAYGGLSNCYKANCADKSSASVCNAFISCEWKGETCTGKFSKSESSNGSGVIIAVVVVIIVIIILVVIAAVVCKFWWLPRNAKARSHASYGPSGVQSVMTTDEVPPAPSAPPKPELDPDYMEAIDTGEFHNPGGFMGEHHKPNVFTGGHNGSGGARYVTTPDEISLVPSAPPKLEPELDSNYIEVNSSAADTGDYHNPNVFTGEHNDPDRIMPDYETPDSFTGDHHNPNV
ncbi:VWFA and cache domain-containing protein 1-like [Glandiceps talaboti]